MHYEDLYRRLQRHLDRNHVAFPATRSGVEIRILKNLFTATEARLVLALSMVPEPAGTIHRRVRRDMTLPQLRLALDSLSDRGLITRLPGRRGAGYAKSAFFVGFYESQVDRLTPEFQRDAVQYLDEEFWRAVHSDRTPQMRTIPVARTIPVPDRVVARYADIEAFVRASDGPFAVMHCLCKQGKDVLGHPCNVGPAREHCLLLGVAADILVARGPGRSITRDEMLALLQQADRDGLVLQPQNTQKPWFVCCCCGCCCGILTTAKKLPRPADFIAANFQAAVDEALCAECGACATRCQMEAVSADGPARVDRSRCIGCGLCASTCPSGAIHLVAKPRQTVPPADTMRLYAQMYRQRYGLTGLLAAAGRNALGMKT